MIYIIAALYVLGMVEKGLVITLLNQKNSRHSFTTFQTVFLMVIWPYSSLHTICTIIKDNFKEI